MEIANNEWEGGKKESKECLALIQSAHLNIYRENSFRITGLPVDASDKEIKKHADKLKIMEELGYGEGANPAAFALDPPPSVDQIRGAMQRLKEPEHRLVDEFFWFWPQEFGKSANDPAIQAILSGDRETAYDIWTSLESNPDHDYTACHNIAVMLHLVALDWTLHHFSYEIDLEREGKIKGFWKESFSRWEKNAIDDRLWDALKARIRVLDDPRLTTGFARRMRDALPEALDKINAEVALRFAEQGRTDWAKTHIEFMNETHQGLDDVEKTAELVLTPTRNRVIQHTKTAKEECEKKPENGANVAGKLIEQCSPLQSIFELFHGSDSHHKAELFDDVARTVVDCLISYQKKTADNECFVTKLNECLQFATGMDVRQSIQENIDIAKGNIRVRSLDPLYAELTEIQASKAKAQVRLTQVKQQMMPRFFALTEAEEDQSSLTAGMSDCIAMVLHQLSIDAHNDEKDFVTAVDCLLLATKLAKDSGLRKRIADDLEAVEKRLQDARCFYCGENMALPSCTNVIAMHGDIERIDGTIKFKHTTISVPRCPSCKKCFKKHDYIRFAVWTSTVLLGVVGGGQAGGAGMFCVGIIGLILAFPISAFAGYIMRINSGLNSEKNYPPINELFKKGWSLGESPG